jgi:transcriptional regulator with XRE-family HTH domain
VGRSNRQQKELRRLGEILRSFRLRTGLSQEELADRAGLHRTYIGSVERGERNPSFLSLQRILESSGARWSTFGRTLDGN